MRVKIKYIADDVKKPFYATPGSAGLDLCAHIPEPVTVPRGAPARIPTGIAIALPDSSHAAFVYARSGLATKHGVCLSNGVGVIDSDYTGEIQVGLINLGPEDYIIQPGDRIAQLVFAPVVQAELDEVDELPATQRGSGGFGSTGK